MRGNSTIVATEKSDESRPLEIVWRGVWRNPPFLWTQITTQRSSASLDSVGMSQDSEALNSLGTNLNKNNIVKENGVLAETRELRVAEVTEGYISGGSILVTNSLSVVLLSVATPTHHLTMHDSTFSQVNPYPYSRGVRRLRSLVRKFDSLGNEVVTKPELGVIIEQGLKTLGSEIRRGRIKGGYSQTRSLLARLLREPSELIPEGRTLVVKPTFDDLCQRLARAGIVNFAKVAASMWKKEPGVQGYIAICENYKIPYDGHTSQIVTVRQFLGMVKEKRASKEAVYAYLCGKVTHTLPELEKAAESLTRFPKTRSLVMAALAPKKEEKVVAKKKGAQIAPTIHTLFPETCRVPRDLRKEGATQSSYTAETSSRYQGYLEKQIDANRAKTQLSVFTLPAMIVEGGLEVINALLSIADPSLCLPSVVFAEWYMLIDVIQNPTSMKVAALTTTPFPAWFASQFSMRIYDLISYFSREPVDIDLPPELIQEMDNPFDWIARAKNSPLWQKVSVMVYHLIGSQFLTGTRLGDAIQGSLKVMSDAIGNTVDGIVAVNDALSYLWSRLQLCYEKRDMTLLFELDATTTAVREMSECTRELSRHDLEGDPRVLRSRAEVLMTRYAKNTHPNVVHCLRNLNEAFGAWEAALKMERIPPVGVMFVGPPGVGKSVAITRLDEVLKKYLGIPKDYNATFYYQDTPFQSIPPLVPLMVLNDYFGVKEERTEVPPLNLLQTLLDSTPVKLNTASLAEKANSFVSPRALIVTTNTRRYTFTSAVDGNASKLNRRLMVCMFSLRSAFVEKHGSYEKALAHLGIPGNFDPEAVCYRFGRLKIPENSNTMVLSGPGATVEWEEELLLHLDMVIARIMRGVIAAAERGKPQHVSDCSGCSLQREACFCKGGPKVTEQRPAKVMKISSKPPKVSPAPPPVAPPENPPNWYGPSHKGRPQQPKPKESVKEEPVEYIEQLPNPPELERQVAGSGANPSASQNRIVPSDVEPPGTVEHRARADGQEEVPTIQPFEEEEESTPAAPLDLIQEGSVQSTPSNPFATFLGNPYQSEPRVMVRVVQEATQKRFDSFVDSMLAGRVDEARVMKDTIRAELNAFRAEVRRLTSNEGAPTFLQEFVKASLVIVAFQLGSKMWSGLNLFKEGALVASLTNVARTPDNSPPYFGKKMPWLGGSVLSYRATMTFKNNPGASIDGFWVSKSVFCTCRHFSDGGSGDFEIKFGSNVVTGSVYNNVVANHPQKDLALIYVPNSSGIYKPGGTKIIAYHTVPQEGHAYCMGQRVNNVREVSKHYILGDDIETLPGDCGNPLYDDKGWIYGIYVGRRGDTKSRYFVPINRGDIDELMRELNERGHPCTLNEFEPEPEMLFIPEMKMGMHPKGSTKAYDEFVRPLQSIGIVSVGNVTIGKKDNVSVEPTLAREIFSFDECPKMTKPFMGKSVCYEKDGKPFWNMPLRKLFDAVDVNHEFPYPIGRAAIELYLTNFVTRPLQPIQPLGKYQAITGSQVNSLINALDSTKAVGLTLKKKFGITKKDLFKQVGSSWEIDERASARIDEWYQHFFSDEPLRTPLFSGTRKAELKEEEKAAKGSARIFSVCDKDYLIAYRMVLMPLMEHLMKYCYESGVFATLNPASKEWGDLLKWFEEFERLDASDQETFDGKHNATQLLYCQFMVMLCALLGGSKEYQKAVKRAILSSCSYIFVCEGEIMFWDFRLNSGLPDTLVRNAVIGMILLIMFLISNNQVVERKFLCSDGTLRYLRQVMHAANTGDDNVVAISRWVSYPIEQKQAYFKKCGYSLTRADKRADLPIGFLQVHELVYLKRRFVKTFMRGRPVVLAPLDKVSILKSVCYTVDVPSEMRQERNRNAVLCAANESFLHGKEWYEEFTTRLADWARQLAIVFPKYDDLEVLYLENKFEPWEPTQGPSAREMGAKVHLDDPATQLPPSDLVLEAAFGSNAHRRELAVSSLRFSSATELNATSSTQLSDAGTVNHLVSDTTTTVSDANPTMFMRRIPDEVSIAEFCARPRLITQYNLNVEPHVDFQCITSFYQVPVVNKFLKTWQFFRGEPTIKVMVTGSTNFNGKIRLWAYPARKTRSSNGFGMFQVQSRTEHLGKNFPMTSQLPHVDMDLSLTGSYELKLGWPSKYEVLDLRDTSDFDWYVAVGVLNPPWTTNGETMEAVPIDIYVSYHNVKVDRVIPEMNFGLETNKKTFSRGLAYAAWVASKLPFAWANSFSMVAKLGSEVASRLGYARLPQEVTKMVITRQLDNPNVIAGQSDFAMTLGLDSVALVNKGKSCLATPGETRVDVLKSKWGQLACSWQPGEDLMVDPDVAVDTDLFGVVSASKFLLPVTFLAWTFRFWRGTTRVKVEVPCSSLIRGRIGLLILPSGVATPSAFVQDGTFLSFVVDVAGSTTFEFDVPYLYNVPFMSSTAHFTGSPSLTRTRVVYYWIAGPFDLGANRAPDVNFYLRGGEDLEFAVPSLAIINRYYVCDLAMDWLLDRAAFVEDFPAVDNPMLVTEGGAALAYFGEEVEDLVALSRRRTSKHAIFVPPLTTLSQPLWPTGPSNTITGAGSETWTMFHWLTQPFHAVSGSITLYSSNSSTYLVYETLGADTAAVVNEYNLASGENLCISAGETRFPDRNFAAFWDPMTIFPINYFQLRMAGASSTNCNILQGGGDDFTFSGFLSAPALKLRVSA